jgi:hypothetical protein
MRYAVIFEVISSVATERLQAVLSRKYPELYFLGFIIMDNGTFPLFVSLLPSPIGSQLIMHLRPMRHTYLM